MKRSLGLGEEIVLGVLDRLTRDRTDGGEAQDRVADMADGEVPRKNVKGHRDGVVIIIVAGSF